VDENKGSRRIPFSSSYNNLQNDFSTPATGRENQRSSWRIDRKKVEDMLEGEMEEREERWRKIFDW